MPVSAQAISDISNPILTALLLFAAAVLVIIALFGSPVVKAVALAYVIVP